MKHDSHWAGWREIDTKLSKRKPKWGELWIRAHGITIWCLWGLERGSELLSRAHYESVLLRDSQESGMATEYQQPRPPRPEGNDKLAGSLVFEFL